MIADFEDYINRVDNAANRDRLWTVLTWVQETFPQLEQRYA
ncbi:hypothetical protein [Levilactobacillus brevis]|nr:hypothetical protein [Levilactobacillus brevis]